MKTTIRNITASHNKLIKGKCNLMKALILEATLEALEGVQEAKNN